MPALRKQSVTELAAERQRLYDIFNGREADDERIDGPQFKCISAIEAKIVKATFKNRADVASGRRMLASGDNPAPIDWCHFKSNLYLRMQQFA